VLSPAAGSGSDDHARGDGVVRGFVDEVNRTGLAVAAVFVEENAGSFAASPGPNLVEPKSDCAGLVPVQRFFNVEAGSGDPSPAARAQLLVCLNRVTSLPA